MSKKLKIISYNCIFFLIFLIILECIFGFWFSKNNFGIHMRNERNKNWKTTATFNDKKYTFFYKRNFYGFRGEEFKPEDVKIIFNGGSTSNQRYTPEGLTVVGHLNNKFEQDTIKLKIYNAATNGKSLRGIIYDFKFWFNKIEKLNPKFMILYLGINERTLASDIGQKSYDVRIKNNKIDQIKDYVKNNSFFYEKYMNIKNLYFPKNTSGYFFDNNDLYKDFKYYNYNQIKKIKKEITNYEVKILNQVEERFHILNKILKKNKITPIIITQIEYNGLEDRTLFLVNNLLKEIAQKNKFHIIKLDELATMKINDFYDEVHTTPKGSERIANIIYPLLKKILNN